MDQPRAVADRAGAEPRGRVREIVAVAREVLEAAGPEGLTMRRLAERLGMRAPSLYKHLPDKEALEHALIEIAFEELAREFEQTDGQTDRLGALGRAYRSYALAHPHLYRLMTARPLDRTRLAPGVEARASRLAVEAFRGDEDSARALWAFVHGMVVLELDGRFPPGADLEPAWERGLAAFRSLVPEGS